MDQDDIEEIVRWQLTGLLMKKSPTVRTYSRPLCKKCGDDWHGLPVGKCLGSFDTPEELDEPTITESH